MVEVLKMDWWKKAVGMNQRGDEEVETGPPNGEKRNGNTATEWKNGKRSHGSEKRKEWKKVEGGTEGKYQIKLENLKNMK